jgi:hypothetical protein
VEDKFLPTPAILSRLGEIGRLTDDFLVHDVYFDLEDHPLVKADRWLRQRTEARGGRVTRKWEIKVPVRARVCHPGRAK